MSFRDDRQALTERASALERDLADAQRELERTRDAAATIDRLEASLAATSAERDLQRAGRAPERRRMVTGLAMLGALFAFSFAAFVYQVFEAGARTDEWAAKGAELESQSAGLTRQLRESQSHEAQLAREVARLREQRASTPLVDVAVSAWQSRTFLSDAHVIAATPHAPVAEGTNCSVAVAVDSDGVCRAEVLCGRRSVFPKSPEGGYFPCTLDREGHILRGSNVDAAPQNGDRRFDFDLTRGTVIVSDGPPPAPSLTLSFGDREAAAQP